MTVHLKWKVLLCTIEAQLQALRNAEILQDVTTVSAATLQHVLPGTRPGATHCL